MINKNRYVYVKVKISLREYELYKKIVQNHNYKKIRHDYFKNYDKISLSKIGLAGFRKMADLLLKDESSWDYYGD